MTTAKHPHDAVIRAYLDGKKIQNRNPLHCGPQVRWQDVTITPAQGIPSFSKDWEYRIKPDPLKYRVALMLRIGQPYTRIIDNTTNSPREATIESLSGFDKWLTDWIEVEVE